eukprot:TRINITY_DN38422_c1_g1_i1.p1 TRINITY_DN38422_c1_g1~~TRINITY_DN38422_c1_g1_i1.p1  ORF type:complete len:179 (+),score=10.16 TRINITY_DN38422_c1_g1_i1:133-669(+)
MLSQPLHDPHETMPEARFVPVPAFLGRVPHDVPSIPGNAVRMPPQQQPTVEEFKRSERRRRQSAAQPTAEEVKRIEKTGRILSHCSSGDVKRFLDEVSSILLASGSSRTTTLTYIGQRFSEWSRSFLDDKKLRLKIVLRCYADHFRLHGKGAMGSVTYLHLVASPRWKLSHDLPTTSL